MVKNTEDLQTQNDEPTPGLSNTHSVFLFPLLIRRLYVSTLLFSRKHFYTPYRQKYIHV